MADDETQLQIIREKRARLEEPMHDLEAKAAAETQELQEEQELREERRRFDGLVDYLEEKDALTPELRNLVDQTRSLLDKSEPVRSAS